MSKTSVKFAYKNPPTMSRWEEFLTAIRPGQWVMIGDPVNTGMGPYLKKIGSSKLNLAVATAIRNVRSEAGKKVCDLYVKVEPSNGHTETTATTEVTA